MTEAAMLEEAAPPQTNDTGSMTSSDDNLANVQIAMSFLNTLFEPEDYILNRPTETWTEAGRKRSRPDYRNTVCRQLKQYLQVGLLQQFKLAERERVNLFFGVCPRFGPYGKYDLAWQIRSVRALWADVDHASVEEVLLRVEQAGLPPPSIVLNSGNGVHLYWLLDEPYLIDDAVDPIPVETEWTKTSKGKKKSRKYVILENEKIYLDQLPRNYFRLSPKALHIQDVLAGLAKAIGGDHTIDLVRLLRLAGSWNRKNQRNGQKPVPTVLVVYDYTLRYALSVFEPLAVPAPETERATKIAAMPLPTVRTGKISPSKLDRLRDLIAASNIAPQGSRSECDFRLCCFAIENGIGKEDVWGQVEQTGKFAEQGRRYFDITWVNAEYEVQAKKFEKLEKQRKQTALQEQIVSGDSDSKPVIRIDPTINQVGDTIARVTDQLLKPGNCFSRTNQLVVIYQEQIDTILKPPELTGLLNQIMEFYFIKEECGEYKPFPTAYANTWLHNHTERSRLPVIELYTRNPVYTGDWRLVNSGYDQASRIYYAGSKVPLRTGATHLHALLRDFCFKTRADRTNYLGVLLTALLVPRFIGSKPAALFNGNQPELGKSILAQIIAILRDGQPAETASYNPNDEEFEKRLGAIVRSGATTIIIDNAKTDGRNRRIDSPCLERSITDPILSFRLLGKSATIRAENSHIFCMTANTPEVSRDLVTRSVVINLYYEGDPDRRTFSIANPEGYALEHRIELLGELIGMVELWKAAGMPLAKTHSRFNKRGWGNIVGGILEANGQPDFLANAAEAAAQLDEVRRDFTELVERLVEHPQGTWTASELVEFCAQHKLLATDLGAGAARSLATKMGSIAGRFVDERFPLSEGQQAVFLRIPERKGNKYRVSVEEKVPNL